MTKAGPAGTRIPQSILFDSFGSSEQWNGSVHFDGRGRAGLDGASFVAWRTVKVFTEDCRPVEPGSERVAFGSPSAATSPLVYTRTRKDGQDLRTTTVSVLNPRRLRPGQSRRILHLLVRGSVVIQHRPAKKSSRSSREVFNQHPSVRETRYVCRPPRHRFGETIFATSSRPRGATVDADELIEHGPCPSAGSKGTRRVIVVDTSAALPPARSTYKAVRHSPEIGRACSFTSRVGNHLRVCATMEINRSLTLP